MIISHEKKFIFIHIPRTGGTSISKSLCKSLGIVNWRSYIGEPREILLDSKDKSEINKLYSDTHRKKYESHKHIKAKELKKIVGDNIWNDYYKFTFVRNPWDRMLSAYYKKRDQQNKLIKNIWPKNKILYKLALILKYKIINKKVIQQKDFITDEKGNIMVDFVGKYENLKRDFNKVCKTINISTNLNERVGPTKHKHYSYYYDQFSKNIIFEAKKNDIEIFNYTFEDKR